MPNLTRLVKLQVINLSCNRLETMPEGAFEGLDQLKRVHLSENKLSEEEKKGRGIDFWRVLPRSHNKFAIVLLPAIESVIEEPLFHIEINY